MTGIYWNLSKYFSRNDDFFSLSHYSFSSFFFLFYVDFDVLQGDHKYFIFIEWNIKSRKEGEKNCSNGIIKVHKSLCVSKHLSEIVSLNVGCSIDNVNGVTSFRRRKTVNSFPLRYLFWMNHFHFFFLLFISVFGHWFMNAKLKYIKLALFFFTKSK